LLKYQYLKGDRMGVKDATRTLQAWARGRPALVEICSGACLKSPMHFGENAIATPLGALGNDHTIGYGVQFLHGLGVRTDAAFHKQARLEGNNFNGLNLIAIVGDDANKLLQLQPAINRVKTLLSFYLATELVPMIRIQWSGTRNPSAAEFLAPRSARGGPSRDGHDPVNEDFLNLCMSDRRDDDRLHYFVGLLEQCLGLFDERLKIARLYSLLESLASPIKSQFSRQAGNDAQSRTSIRYMLGYFLDKDIPRFTLQDPDEDFEFDHIELAGRLRDKIFHGGGALSIDSVPDILKPGVRLLELQPRLLVHWLRRDCEQAIVDWGKHQGRAWSATEGEHHQIPPRRADYNGRELIKPLIAAGRAAHSSIFSIYTQVRGADIGVVRLRLEQ
jgi:hypothetical protein